MWIYALRRLILTIPILLGVTIICFLLVQIAPGDPIQSLLPPDASEADAAALRAYYGLDKPLVIQYIFWLGKVVTGDLGMSIQVNAPVATEVGRAFANTFTLAMLAVALAFVVSLFLGVVAAYKSGTWIDKLFTSVAVFGISVPTFWLGVVLVIVFAVQMNWLPAAGMGANGSEHFSYFRWDDFKFAIMPMVALALPPLGIMTRTTRSSVEEVLNQDFVQTLRAKGLGEVAVLRHAIKNAMPQIIAMLGLQLGYLIGGSVLVEMVFNWPGTGYLLNKAILSRDLPVLQGTILVLATSFVMINLVIDLAQSVIDPRIKRS
ncbi:MAG: ABC transporter permease [Rhodobacteraceae bacterium]|nr:ABC transporter permease [Paracoccaceae bacterium]MAY45978.1 ABC transporter permease [Paracoccaceae bacterium]QEW18605.1 ABC-transporter permease protein [Marinibacterium anthonyi]